MDEIPEGSICNDCAQMGCIFDCHVKRTQCEFFISQDVVTQLLNKLFYQKSRMVSDNGGDINDV